MNTINSMQSRAPSMTKAASRQTYYTIRLLADRDRIADAYRAYAYFRWVDDVLDGEADSRLDRNAFIRRQRSILDQGYCRSPALDATIQERMLVELIQNDPEEDSGLKYYLRNMMAVMEFDTGRRGRLISQAELNEYTRLLAGAVTEAMHYFIGHDCHSPRDDARYLAVTAAHITHMLRDTFDDIRAGYYNIPLEVLNANGLSPLEVGCETYRAWVRSRVNLARMYFKEGREYLKRVGSPRCQLAGLAYAARFEWLLDAIEREGYVLRPHYNERKSFRIGLRMGLDTLMSVAAFQRSWGSPQSVSGADRVLGES